MKQVQNEIQSLARYSIENTSQRLYKGNSKSYSAQVNQKLDNDVEASLYNAENCTQQKSAIATDDCTQPRDKYATFDSTEIPIVTEEFNHPSENNNDECNSPMNSKASGTN